MTFIHKIDDIMLRHEVYAILTPTSTLIPGDERSRTNPGHGYPEHLVENWDIEIFLNKEDWEKEAKRRYERPGTFLPCRINPAQIRKEVTVTIHE
jgi:hypothetical protein